jgi:RNA polymerase sigma-70 factor (ECF subfamily)
LFQAINDFQDGNKKRATYIYQSTKKYTYSVIYRNVSKFKSQNLLLTDVNAATEDIMQDLYIEFFQNIAKFKNENEKSFYKWIAVVANRMTLKYVDKNKMEVLQWEQSEEFREEREIGDSAEELENSEENSDFIPESALENKEFKELLLQFVKNLPEEQTQTILYHIYGDMKYQEIADLMGVSLITVKTRMRKAKDSLREMIYSYEEKSGTKLRSVALLPLLMLLLRIQMKQVKIPIATEYHVLKKIYQCISSAIPASMNSMRAFFKTIGAKYVVPATLSLAVIGGGAFLAVQEKPTVQTDEKAEDTHVEQEVIEEQQQNQEQKHMLIWNGQEIDITEYIYETEYYQIADGTYQGTYITTDDVLLKMGFERTFDTEGNPFYTWGDFCISYYMGTDQFGLGAMGHAEKYAYGISFFEKEGSYYVDSRLALRILAMDGILGQASYGEFTMRAGEEAKEDEQKLTKIERTTMHIVADADVYKSAEESGESLGKVSANTAVIKLGEAGEFEQIFFKGTIGYIKKNVESTDHGTSDTVVTIPEVEGNYFLYINDEPININDYVYQGDYYTDATYGHMRRWLVNERIIVHFGFSQTDKGENVVYSTKSLTGEEIEIVIYGPNSFSINGHMRNAALEVEVVNGVKYVNPYQLVNNVIGMTGLTSGGGAGSDVIAVNFPPVRDYLYSTPAEGYRRGDDYARYRFDGIVTYLKGEKEGTSLEVIGEHLNYANSIYVSRGNVSDDSWMYMRIAKWPTSTTSSDNIPGIVQSVMSQICGLESSTRTELYVLVSNLLYQYADPRNVPTQGVVSEDVPGLYVTLTQSSEGLEIRFFAE